jgi:hypothetical protein
MALPVARSRFCVDARLDALKLEDWIEVYRFIRRSVPPHKANLAFDTNVAAND